MQRLLDEPSLAEEVRKFVAHALESGEGGQALSQLQERFGFDFNEAVFILSAYGANEPPSASPSSPPTLRTARDQEAAQEQRAPNRKKEASLNDFDWYLDSGVELETRFAIPAAAMGSLPFPAPAAPEIMRSHTYFIERPRPTLFFLRSTLNPLFCQAIWPVEVTFVAPVIDDEGYGKFSADGEQLTEEQGVDCLVTTFEGQYRTVGYHEGDSWKYFLRSFETNKPLREIPLNLKLLYGGANLGRAENMSHSDSELEEWV